MVHSLNIYHIENGRNRSKSPSPLSEDQFINSVILIFSITGRCGFLTAPSIVRKLPNYFI